MIISILYLCSCTVIKGLLSIRYKGQNTPRGTECLPRENRLRNDIVLNEEEKYVVGFAVKIMIFFMLLQYVDFAQIMHYVKLRTMSRIYTLYMLDKNLKSLL